MRIMIARAGHTERLETVALGIVFANVAYMNCSMQSGTNCRHSIKSSYGFSFDYFSFSLKSANRKESLFCYSKTDCILSIYPCNDFSQPFVHAPCKSFLCPRTLHHFGLVVPRASPLLPSPPSLFVLQTSTRHAPQRRGTVNEVIHHNARL